MTVEKPQKKFPTKVTNKDKKKFKPCLDTQKKYKKGFTNTLSQKNFSTKVAKKIKKNSKKGFLKTA